jgi:hypothetical protein
MAPRRIKMAAEAACRCSLIGALCVFGKQRRGAHRGAIVRDPSIKFFEPATACDTAGAFKRPTAYEATSTNESVPHYDTTGSHECAATYERPTPHERAGTYERPTTYEIGSAR